MRIVRHGMGRATLYFKGISWLSRSFTTWVEARSHVLDPGALVDCWTTVPEEALDVKDEVTANWASRKKHGSTVLEGDSLEEIEAMILVREVHSL